MKSKYDKLDKENKEFTKINENIAYLKNLLIDIENEQNIESNKITELSTQNTQISLSISELQSKILKNDFVITDLQKCEATRKQSSTEHEKFAKALIESDKNTGSDFNKFNTSEDTDRLLNQIHGYLQNGLDDSKVFLR